MRPGVLLAVLLLAALSVPGATSAAGSASFADTAGDAGPAPDLTTVIVANDELGLITFRITVTNRSTLGPDDLIVSKQEDLAPGFPDMSVPIELNFYLLGLAF